MRLSCFSLDIIYSRGNWATVPEFLGSTATPVTDFCFRARIKSSKLSKREIFPLLCLFLGMIFLAGSLGYVTALYCPTVNSLMVTTRLHGSFWIKDHILANLCLFQGEVSLLPMTAGVRVCSGSLFAYRLYRTHYDRIESTGKH